VPCLKQFETFYWIARLRVALPRQNTAQAMRSAWVSLSNPPFEHDLRLA
jgi:hypothetical protein